GVVSAGGVFPLLERRDACRAVQVALLGGVFSQFNLDAPSQELVNSDFVVGFEATHRRGVVSARLRVYHQSSHLGDEFLLRNPEITRFDFGFQAVDGLLSLERGPWRAYGGAGVRFFSHRSLPPAVVRG